MREQRWIQVYSPTILAVACALLAGCAPAAGQSGGEARTDGGASPTVVDRPVRMASTNEPPVISGSFGGGSSGTAEYAELFAAKLTRYDYLREPMPQLASELPNLTTGTWNVFDDGRMETTYRLRPAAWHDGQALTAEDVIFTWRTILRPDLPAGSRTPEQYIESIEAIDPNTVVMRWKSLYIYANVYEQEPIPHHLFGPLLERDPQAFVNSDYWRTNWVGLGPYQLVDWVQGSYVRGRAFPNYVFGAPKISEIVVYFISDPNQAIARMLAGDIDLTVGSLLKVEEGTLLKEQMRGGGDIVTMKAGVRLGEYQLGPSGHPPLKDLRVRRGIAHAVDRQQLVDVLWFSLTSPADMFLQPDFPAFAAADRVITKYPYDQNRALRLFEEAGWTKGASGILQNPAGERFKLGLRSLDRADYVKEVQILEQAFQAVGVEAEIDFYTRAMQNDREYRAKFPGLAFGGGAGSLTGKVGISGYSAVNIPSEANRWAGGNRGAYSNPAAEELIARYDLTVDSTRRDAILVDFLKILTADLPVLAMYYVLDVYAVRTGLNGVAPSRPGEAYTTANAHLLYWDR